MIRRLAGKVPIKILFVPILILALSSCKLRIVVPEGGRVVSASGAYQCVPGKPCKIEVVDIFFNEVFVAQADQGFYFRRWKGGDRKLCADSFDNCKLSTAAFEDNPILEQFLESDEIFYLRPLFALGICEPGSVSTEDVFGNISRQEGLQCKGTPTSSSTYQGVVKSYRNNIRVSEAGYDQGRLHGTQKLYFEDGESLQEASEYREGKLQGAQKIFDASGRPLSISRWQQGKLQGKSTSYNYVPSGTDENAAIISTDYYEGGMLNGASTITYPDGAWETRQWANGVQFGEYQVFVPNASIEILGLRYVYGFNGGLIRYGAGFTRFAISGSDEYREEAGPVWQCAYIDEVLDEEDCFRDNLMTLGPRL